MNIKIRSLIEGSKEATGIVVIIDVLRACTTIPILLNQGVTEIIPVEKPEDSKKYKSLGYILIGEGQHGHIHEVFDYNNSPSEIKNIDFSGKKVILRSNNATQAILNAKQASEIILASFVNLHVISNYIKSRHLQDVTLVPLGRLGKKGIEDELCATAIKFELENKNFNFKEMKKKIYNCETAILVRETLKKPYDVDLALVLNSYPIIPKVFHNKNYEVIRTI